MDKLKQCPFCGANAIFIEHESMFYISCRQDCIRSNVGCKERLTNDWNKRTSISLKEIKSCLPENPYPEDIFPMTTKQTEL